MFVELLLRVINKAEGVLKWSSINGGSSVLLIFIAYVRFDVLGRKPPTCEIFHTFVNHLDDKELPFGYLQQDWAIYHNYRNSNQKFSHFSTTELFRTAFTLVIFEILDYFLRSYLKGLVRISTTIHRSIEIKNHLRNSGNSWRQADQRSLKCGTPLPISPRG